MNNYQLIHGDTLEELKKMDSDSVDLIVTSPPYPGADNMWEELYKQENFYKAHEFLNKIWIECIRVLRSGCKLCINIANTKRKPYLPNTAMIYQCMLGISDQCEPIGEIIWVKYPGTLGTSWGSYRNPSDPCIADNHEYILMFRKNGNRIKQSGYFIDTNSFMNWRYAIWDIPPASSSKFNHIAPFPEEIPKRLILLYSYPGEIVLDPFCGRLTTGLMALNYKRNYIGIDHEEKYIKLSKQYLDSNINQQELYFEEVKDVKKRVKQSKLF